MNVMNEDRQMMFRRAPREGGITLLTVALLLLLLGGALMAGIYFLRASMPGDLAVSQKDALLWAAKAIQGFAA
ncbi:MAG: hypothetical protein LBJ76_04515, partial [Candidatus Accumulibacter sp.]|nr:hypothetical protein [Accumulibacter sp.]